MARFETISVTVRSELADTVRDAVASGDYASTGEVVHEALCDWELRRAQREQMIEEIGRLWDEGLASGPAVDGEEAFERLRERLETRIARKNSA